MKWLRSWFSLVALLVGCSASPATLPERPAAHAGMDQWVRVGGVVWLDGSQSQPGGGSVLSYQWSFENQPNDSTVNESGFSPNGDAHAATTSFIPDRSGRYVIRLRVKDGRSESVDDFVIVDASGDEPLPIADAGFDQTVYEGMAVYLNGITSTDPEGEPLYYRWTVAGSPALSSVTDADLINRYTPYPTLVVDTDGVFTLGLIVSDGRYDSLPDYVFVTVEPYNTAPFANAGPDRQIERCSYIELDGSSSIDIDADPLSYAWSVLLAPATSGVSTDSLIGQNEATTRFYADQLGTYAVELRVSDGRLWGEPDWVELEATERSSNQLPLADAGLDITLYGEVSCTGAGSNAYCPNCPAVVMTINGDGSSDPDGDPLSYRWSRISGDSLIINEDAVGTEVELRSASTSVGKDSENEYQFRLTTTDCPGDETTDDMVITYICKGTG